MKYNLILSALLFVSAAKAQGVFNLQSNTSQIENLNAHNERIGEGKVISQNNNYFLSGSLSDLQQQQVNYNSKFSIRNEADGLELELSFYLNPVVYAKGLESKFEGNTVSFPKEIKEEMSLQDSDGTFTFYVNGKSFLTEKVRLIDRKVIKSELVTYKAITARAYIISSHYISEKTNKVGTTKSTAQITEWFIPEVGIVKSERKGIDGTIIFNLQ